MKIKLSFHRNGAVQDLLSTVDTGATVGDLADRLWRSDPLLRGSGLPAGRGRPTLVLGGASMPLDPTIKLAECGLQSGMAVGLTWVPDGFGVNQGETVAVVTVVAGPDKGREYAVRSTSGVIGREPDSAVVLSDPLVSRKHMRFAVGTLAEVTDLGSVNGMEVNGSPVARAVLRPDDVVQIGDTQLRIRVVKPSGTGADGAAEGHVRAPRLDPHYPGVTFDAPEPPKRPQAPRFPIIPLIAPVIMGGLFYLFTRSLVSLLFVAFSPLMLVGYATEQMISGRSTFKKAVKVFRADLADLEKQATAATVAEVGARAREHPSIEECIEAVRTRGVLLWTRRPADPGYAELRLGLGRQPSRNTITLPSGRDLPRDLLAEAAELARRFATVDPVPVLARPAEHGAIGLAGPRQLVLGMARSLVAQAVALHSPAEFVVFGFATDQRARDWDWLKWLPHTTSAHSPIAARPLAATDKDAVVLVSALEDLLEQREGDHGGQAPTVFVLVEDAVPIDRSRLVALAERGWKHGIVVLWLAEDPTHLPAACRTFVVLRPGSETGVAAFVHSGESVEPLRVELLSGEHVLDLGRRLSPLVDVGARVNDDSDLPRSVSLLALDEAPMETTEAWVLESWQGSQASLSKKGSSLKAVIGRSAAGPYTLDLVEEGPHALVGGTTGSGKSEMLQTWLLAMAAAHSPQRLSFMLIDYKGGAAFKDLAALPHNVGLFTDLDPHLVRRALDSLKAELVSREDTFRQRGVGDLIEMEKIAAADAPPRLVIVVDEFAALVKEQPDFVAGMVDVAQRGRSLGVHLILATQRPAGVISDNLRANMNLRVALRTADEEASSEVLGSPDAAFFDPAIRGRAIAKTGPRRLVPFQTAYAGGWTTNEPPPPQITIEELAFGARKLWEPPDLPQARRDLGDKDIVRMIRQIRAASVSARLPLPAQPWKQPLAPVYDLSVLPRTRNDGQIVFGVQDLPKQQVQPVIAYHPDDDGNLAIFGTAGSGKSTMLRSIAISAGPSGRCWVYGLDFGNRGLSMLEGLPHVGAIVGAADDDRIRRLVKWLALEVDRRATKYSKAGAGSLAEYRSRPEYGAEPRILLLVDAFQAFQKAYETADRTQTLDLFQQIVSGGTQFGVHVVLTADRPASVPLALASSIPTRVALRLADPSDYSYLGMPSDVITHTSPPGRGMLLGTELQVAVLGMPGSAGRPIRVDGRHQAEAAAEFAITLRQGGIPEAKPILGMPERVLLAQLAATVGDRPVLGMAAETLAEAAFEPRGGFLISGPSGSGRTATLRSLANALLRWNKEIQLILFSPTERSDLAALDVWTERALGADKVRQHAELLARHLQGGTHPPVAVFLESVTDFTVPTMQMEVVNAVTGLVSACLSADVLVVGEAETSTYRGKLGPVELLKRSRYGLALSPDSADGDAVFSTRFPIRVSRAAYPPGHGLLVRGGQTTQVAVGWVDETP